MSEMFVKKLEILSDLFKIVNDLSEMRVNVNSVSVKTSENVLNIWDNNCGKMCRISTECKERIEMNVKYEWNQQFVCFWPKCRFTSNNNDELIRHISSHLNKKQFKCNECEKSFNQISSLKSHKQQIHSNDRPFICPVSECGKRFKCKKDLNSHQRCHSNERPFICDQIGCQMKFKTKHYLLLHKRIHSNHKPYKCDECGKRFRQMAHLKRHKCIGFVK